MGFLQNARQRLGSAAHAVGKHAVTAGKIALATAAVAGAAYNAHQTHGAVQARTGHAYGGGGGFTNPLRHTPGSAALELLREAREESRMGWRR